MGNALSSAGIAARRSGRRQAWGRIVSTVLHPHGKCKVQVALLHRIELMVTGMRKVSLTAQYNQIAVKSIVELSKNLQLQLSLELGVRGAA